MYGYVGGDPVNFTDPSGLQEDGPTIFVDGKKLTIDAPSFSNAVAAGASLMGAFRIHGGDSLGVGGIIDCNVLGCSFNSDIDVIGEEPDKKQSGPTASAASELRWASYCEFGNTIMHVSEKAGDASLALTATGLSVTLIGGISGNPAVIAGGSAVATAGSVIGIGAGGLQVVGGLAQGISGGGYKNAIAGTVSLGTGVILSKVLRASIPRGWRGASRDIARRNNDITGNVVGALMSFSEWLAPSQTRCSR